MFILFGITAALTALLYGRFADRISRSVLLYATSAVGMVTYLIIWFLIREDVAWVYPFFYVWAEVVANLFLLQFWTLAADFDNPREARRLNPLVGAARPLGIIFFGVSTALVVVRVGTEQFIFVLILLMGIFAASVYLLRNEPRHNLAIDLGPSRRRVPEEPAPGGSYFKALVALLLVMFVTLTVGDYQFKMLAGSVLKEDGLARFFALFYGIVGILSMGFQLAITPRLLSKQGVGSALTVMPGIFGASSLWLLVNPGLAAASAMKFADNGLQYTLHETTMQSLYVPFSAATRARTRGWLEGAVKPLAYGAGGMLLVLLGKLSLDVRQMSFVTLSLVILWQLLIPIVRKGYIKSLEKGFAGPMAAQMFEEPFVIGAAERKILLRSLDASDSMRTLISLEQLQKDTSDEFKDILLRLLNRPEAPVRARAIQLLGSLDDGTHAAQFQKACQDKDPMVRASAFSALARFFGNENPNFLFSFMSDPSIEVRVEVLAGLLRYGGVEAKTRAGVNLLRLQDSTKPEERKEACAVLARLGRTAYPSLRNLMGDLNPSVRRAAMRAAASAMDPRLVPLMMEGLYDPGVRNTSMAALIAMGKPTVDLIGRVLNDPVLPRPVRLELPRMLSRIPTGESMGVLRNYMETPDSHMRLRVYAAMGRLRRNLGIAPLPIRQLLPRIDREVDEAYVNLLGWNGARKRFGTRLLSEEIEFRLGRAEKRILRLLELSYPLPEVVLIMTALEDPLRRPEALEALDALLSPALRERILPLFENRNDPDALAARAKPSVRILPPVEFMLLQARHINPYVVLLSLDSLARAGECAAIPAAKQALHHRDPLVREGGLRALNALDGAATCESAQNLVSDPDPSVSLWARWLVTLPFDTIGCPGIPSETVMYGTVEKILFLKGTSLFAGLSGEDLAPLARVATVTTFSTGDEIFTEGIPSHHFYVIISGLVALESQGKELRRIGPPETLGELAVLDGGPQDASACALQPTELLRVGAEELFELLHEQVQIAEALIRILAGQVREAHQRLASQAPPPNAK